MARSIGELAKNLGKKDERTDSRLLADAKGLGKMEVFNNYDSAFRRLPRPICHLTVRVFGQELQDVLLSYQLRLGWSLK